METPAPKTLYAFFNLHYNEDRPRCTTPETLKRVHYRINLRSLYLAMHRDDIATVLHLLKFTPNPRQIRATDDGLPQMHFSSSSGAVPPDVSNEAPAVVPSTSDDFLNSLTPQGLNDFNFKT